MSMQTRTLGHSGLQVSLVGLGCNNFGAKLDQEETNAVVRRALDAGITLFDTADVYGGTQGGPKGTSELMLGRALGSERSRIVLASKFGADMGTDEHGPLKGAKPEYIRRAVEASLQRLGTDYLDLYQLHTPDPGTPIAETLGALDELVQRGLVRFIGCSNLSAAQVEEAEAASEAGQLTRFTSCQDEYSLLVRGIEAELIPVMQRQGLGLLPYFPLASGLLTGKYHRGEALPEGSRLASWKNSANRYLTPQNLETVERLREFAEERGHTLLELAFSWLAAQPVVSSVIAGATSPQQIDQNVAAVGWTLDAAELSDIAAITGGVPA
ncbi:aldo/keto reductase [Deinococcus sp. KNUC1210]|uniref:aldo/keto reductase n=1 Tax=Deinococcus sp. KNUC1210 TaxID=2917691 RepID=UPI001EF0A4EC|nr:aldo/keto reductase [Deinococcus sp. KNUC1210]ULH14523.1 aldo/keto reductase [Deinococcus sp. KNUC1210]